MYEKLHYPVRTTLLLVPRGSYIASKQCFRNEIRNVISVVVVVHRESYWSRKSRLLFPPTILLIHLHIWYVYGCFILKLHWIVANTNFVFTASCKKRRSFWLARTPLEKWALDSPHTPAAFSCTYKREPGVLSEDHDTYMCSWYLFEMLSRLNR